MRLTAAVLSALSLAACASTSPPPPEPAPVAQGPTAMVAAADPRAVEAGLKVLKAGGTAADAAVAVQAVLGLVEPQSSGLGGGAFLVYRDGASGKVSAYNGRETAPMGATADMFLDADGKALPFPRAVLSGRSTGVPGAIAMLALAHKDHGTLPWAGLFADAEALADNGFVVGERLAAMIDSDYAQGQAKTPDAQAYFSHPDGTPYKAGETIVNTAYGDSLRAVAASDGRALYDGPLAEAIVAATHEDPLPGTLDAADMKAYRPVRTDALCGPYRVYVVCVPRPPSSGVALLQALAMLERTDIATRGPTDPVAWVELAEAERLMYADRDRYVGDPDYVRVPLEGLLDPGYVAKRAAMIGQSAGPPPKPGDIPEADFAPDATTEPGGTSHFVIVDKAGDVASMTTTVESMFGSGRMVGGFFINNQLTDFSFSPVEKDGHPAANAVAPGKRPRSSMSPVIVLDKDGGFVAALGSPGGTAILSYNLKTLVGVLDWGLTMQQAIDLPNLVAKGPFFASEPERFAPGVVEALAARGITFSESGAGENSGLHGVIVRPAGLEGGADSRREGVARGY